MAFADGLRRVKRKLIPSRPERDPFPNDAWTQEGYQAWFEEHRATPEELERQRAVRFREPITFSIVVPLFKTPREYLDEMAGSVLCQTYPNLELILVNASPEDELLSARIDEIASWDERVKIVRLQENRGITENTNEGIRAATGDFVCFLDHDDLLEPDALFHFASALDSEPETDLLYCDEDLVEKGDDGQFKHRHPFFKPDHSPELMLCRNGIIHLMTIRREMLKEMPIPDARFDGAQDYNMVLFAAQRARSVHHESRILYHWRMNEESTANNPDAKPYAKIASRLAIANNLEGGLLDARIIGSGILNTQNLWFGSSGESPVVSVVVDGGASLSAANAFWELFRQTNGYDRIEVIIVCDGRVEGAHALALDGEVAVLYAATGSSRFSRFNEGAKAAKGEYLLFMDADASFQTPEPLEQLLGMCSREGVGVVAPKTLYGDGSVKCYGIAVTPERIMPLYRGYPDDFPGYQCNTRSFQNNSAASYLGLMTPKSLFDEVGGFDDGYDAEIGAADYCRRVIMAGKRIVQTCTVKVQSEEKCPELHYDNKTNAPDFTPEDLARFDEKWPGVRAAGDPYFNENLDQSSSYFQIAPRVKGDS